VSGRTALFSPEPLLKLDGLDDIRREKGADNPFWNRARFEVTWGLAVMSGLTGSDRVTVQPMRMASRDELMVFHDLSYVETLELFGNMGVAFSARFGLDTEDCPIFHNVDKYASFPVGSTVDAVMGVAEGRFRNAMSFFGGFHHAMESKAGGFCYYNDCVIAAKKYRAAYPDKRILILDTDVHHGDGTQRAFYSDPNVLTVSTHEMSMGFFPGSGRSEDIGIGNGKGYSINVPLPPLTDDTEFWRPFDEVVLPVWRIYRPDLVIWEVGADAHMGDPLADLMLTLDSYQRLSRSVNQLVHRYGTGLVVVGGGGYNPVSAARVWTLVLADLAGACLPPALPAEWLSLCEKYGLKVDCDGWTDVPHRLSCEHEPNIRRAVSESIDKLKELVFPVYGL
jgi:acetoin utilization protein AcuC